MLRCAQCCPAGVCLHTLAAAVAAASPDAGLNSPGCSPCSTCAFSACRSPYSLHSRSTPWLVHREHVHSVPRCHSRDHGVNHVTHVYPATPGLVLLTPQLPQLLAS